jgi:hypothetical protein
MQSPKPTPAEIAAFVARMLDEIGRLVAEHAELSTLEWLIEVARDYSNRPVCAGASAGQLLQECFRKGRHLGWLTLLRVARPRVA